MLGGEWVYRGVRARASPIPRMALRIATGLAVSGMTGYDSRGTLLIGNV